MVFGQDEIDYSILFPKFKSVILKLFFENLLL